MENTQTDIFSQNRTRNAEHVNAKSLTKTCLEDLRTRFPIAYIKRSSGARTSNSGLQSRKEQNCHRSFVRQVGSSYERKMPRQVYVQKGLNVNLGVSGIIYYVASTSAVT